MTKTIECDYRILSKSGILLFSQRYINRCHIKVLPDTGRTAQIELISKSDGDDLPSVEDLQNELLECEFIATRYEETKELRREIRERIIRAADGGDLRSTL